MERRNVELDEAGDLGDKPARVVFLRGNSEE